MPIAGLAAILWLASADLKGQTPTVDRQECIDQDSEPPGSPAVAPGRGRPGGRGALAGVYKSRITPNWFEDNAKFWYRNDLRGGDREFILVDAEHGTRDLAFDHAKLGDRAFQGRGRVLLANRLPLDAIQFVKDGKAVRFQVGNVFWTCDLTSYECARDESPTAVPAASEAGGGAAGAGRNGIRREGFRR